MRHSSFYLVSLILVLLLSASSLYAQRVHRSLRTCSLKAKPGDASGSYVDPTTGVLTFVPLPTPTDPLDQHLQSYNIALCNRLDNGEISRAEFESLLNGRIADIYQERRKLAMEAIKLDQERKRQELEKQRLSNEQNSIQAQRQATQARRQATQAQRQTTQARRQATQAQRRATQAQREAIQAQREATQALNNSAASRSETINLFESRRSMNCTTQYFGNRSSTNCY